MKRKELFWLVLPCLLFAGVAWWLAPREAQSLKQSEAAQRLRHERESKPFRLIIERVEKKVATPREVAQGFDTKVVVLLSHEGLAPPWWGRSPVSSYGSWRHDARLAYEKPAKTPNSFDDNALQELRIMYYRPAPQDDFYEASFLMALRDLPPTDSRVFLNAPLAPEARMGKLICPPAKLHYVVRAAQQRVAAPAVSLDSHIEIQSITLVKIDAATQKTNGGYDTEIQIQARNTGEIKGSMTWEKTQYEDGRGQALSQNIEGGGNGNSYRNSPVTNFSLLCRLNAVPAKVSDVFLRLHLINGDYWPLELHLPLRANGKDNEGTLNAEQYDEKPAAADTVPRRY